ERRDCGLSSSVALDRILRDLGQTKLEPAVVVERGTTVKLLPAGDLAVVEKYFGSCVAIAKANGAIGETIFVEYEVVKEAGKEGQVRQVKRKVQIMATIIGVGKVQALASNTK
ncbi:MAG: hypothetical protein KDB07_03750, partial [Planctomycetes bacterium]|nr:hypothetical protein [Planctomycetota bacterium]